jgi:hypothetical protein
MLPETQTVLQAIRRRLLGPSLPAEAPPPPIVINTCTMGAVAPCDDLVSETPDVSAMPSSANLLGMEAAASEQRRRQNAIRQLSVSLHIPHSAKSRTKEVAKSTLTGLARLPALLLLLYIFVCSLDFLTTAFRLIAGKAAGVYEDTM